MTIATAEALEDARKRLEEAELPEEKAEAARLYVLAEEAHFDRLGVSRAHKPPNPVTRALPAILVLVMIVSLALTIALSVTAHQTSERVGRIQAEQTRGNLETCQRSNKSRAANVRNLVGDKLNLIGDRRELEAELRLYKDLIALSTPQAAAQTPPSIAEAFTELISTKEAEIPRKTEAIRRKTEAIGQSIQSQAKYAIKPGSAIVNCSLAVSGKGSTASAR